jgi:murein DD-endopeptidase MepM/ murein hydrolase activator NlpD
MGFALLALVLVLAAGAALVPFALKHIHTGAQAPEAEKLVIPDEVADALLQASDFGNGPAQTIIDLPGDPVVITRQNSVDVLSSRVLLAPALAGKDQPVETTVSMFTTNLMPNGSELADGLDALASAVAAPAPVEAEAEPQTGSGDSSTSSDFATASEEDSAAMAAQSDDALAEALVENSSALELRRGKGPSSIKQATTHVTTAETISAALVNDGFSHDSAQAVEEASERLINRKSVNTGETVIAAGSRTVSGEYRAMQVSIYDQQEYVGTIAWTDSGGYTVGAEPPLPDDALAAQPLPPRARTYNVSEGIAAAGIRTGMSEAAVREANAVLSKVVDMKQAVAANDSLTLVYSATPRDEAKDVGRIVYIGVRLGATVTQCYVFRTSRSPFQCIKESGVIDGSEIFAPVENAELSSGFGMQLDTVVGAKRLHPGIDWKAPVGTPVMAIADGKIAFAGSLKDLGNQIRIQHGETTTTIEVSDAGGKGGDVISAFVVSGIMAESGNNPNAQNALSSAGGLGQFIDSTWIAIVRKHAPEVAAGKTNEELLAMKKGAATADLQLRMTRAYAQDNANILSAAGITITTSSLYAAHFLGVQLAVQVLRSDDLVPMSKFMSEKAIAANPRQATMNVGDFRVWLARRMGGRTSRTITAGSGYETSYSHLDRFALNLRVGQKVAKGDVIGYVGTTGVSTEPHLHFRYYLNQTPVDPMLYLPRQKVTLQPAEKAAFDEGRIAIDSAIQSVGLTSLSTDGAAGAQGHP